MIISRFLFILIISLSSGFAFAQTADTTWVRPFARQVVNQLASPEMHGRGYTQNGHKIAANYIARQFKDLGLRSFGNGYFQEFPISVNTFPSNADIVIDKKALTAGTDFLVSPCSGPLKGKYDFYAISPLLLTQTQQLLNCLTEAEGKVILIDQTTIADSSNGYKAKVQSGIDFLSKFRNNPAVAVALLTDQKLTWHIAQQPCPLPQFTIRKEALPAGASTIQFSVKSKFEASLTTQNVVGLLPGKNPEAGIIAITAHYDHLGELGKNTYFPGANDNASGVAMLLSLARHFSQQRPEQSILFIAFGAEEVGLLGSAHFVKNPLVPLDQINFLLNLDINGTGEEGIKVVNGKIFTEQFGQLQEINSQHKLLARVAARGEACNSDHCLFYQAGVPSFFLYTLGGIQAYHDPQDKAETLPLTAFPQLFLLLQKFVVLQ